ncbi:uncharacterized protein LOC112567196 [Pomacea canaliculata]|uniref:uncharacterized protein LOC112567196 n=1 Tax=Pomacea canaliculata TaxID=400727 RepID=UPI000D732F2B|nr:uncharacterized protein LOC112567196 [Pomacea canaliculata]XP_025099583.1 uncharacterized protein LOC112567196 [Pomacea canaliculata]
MVLVDNSLEGKEKPLGRHIVIQQPHNFQHHEVEDLDKLSSVVFTKSHDQSHWNTQLYKAIALNEALGKDLVEDFTDIQGEGVVSLAGRLKSFPENWTGTPVMTLAQAGMYYKEGNILCYNCGVRFFDVDSGQVDPTTRHKLLAPNCLHLQRFLQQGSKPLAAGKALRRNSTSSLYVLKNASLLHLRHEH